MEIFAANFKVKKTSKYLYIPLQHEIKTNFQQSLYSHESSPKHNSMQRIISISWNHNLMQLHMEFLL